MQMPDEAEHAAWHHKGQLRQLSGVHGGLTKAAQSALCVFQALGDQMSQATNLRAFLLHRLVAGYVLVW